MRRKTISLVVAISTAIIILCAGVAWAQSDTLSITDGEIAATGAWAFGFDLYYSVTSNPNGTYHYLYTFTAINKSLSHVILETSANFTTANILQGITGHYADYEIGTFSGTGNKGSNPYMPDSIYGIKINLPGNGEYTTATYEFDSDRVPMWGSFYAKDGKSGDVFNAAWNTGLDPNAVDKYYILVPDTQTSIVPEIPSMLLAAPTLAGIWRLKRRGRD